MSKLDRMRAIEDIRVALVGSSGEKALHYAVKEGNDAAKTWYKSHDFEPTEEELQDMAHNAESHNSNAFVGGFITSTVHRKNWAGSIFRKK